MSHRDIIDVLRDVASMPSWHIRTGDEDHARMRAGRLACLLEQYQRLAAGDWSVVPSVALGGLRTDGMTVGVRLAHGRLKVDYTVTRHSQLHETEDGWSPSIRGSSWTEDYVAVPLDEAPEAVQVLARQVLEAIDVDALARKQAAAWWRDRVRNVSFDREVLETMAVLAERVGRQLDVEALERAINEAIKED